MSIRFGISTIESTRPRFVRCRKFDWTLDAICETSKMRIAGTTDIPSTRGTLANHARFQQTPTRRPGKKTAAPRSFDENHPALVPSGYREELQLNRLPSSGCYE